MPPPYVGGDPAPAKSSRKGLWIALAVAGRSTGADGGARARPAGAPHGTAGEPGVMAADGRAAGLCRLRDSGGTHRDERVGSPRRGRLCDRRAWRGHPRRQPSERGRADQRLFQRAARYGSTPTVRFGRRSSIPITSTSSCWRVRTAPVQLRPTDRPAPDVDGHAPVPPLKFTSLAEELDRRFPRRDVNGFSVYHLR